MKILKRLASKLPKDWQAALKRAKFRNDIRAGRFHTDEQEYGLLPQWVSSGDWVLDIGANVGHYSFRLSELVGASGRVIAFEPVSETFELLACNVRHFPYANTTLLNTAASDESSIAAMSVPAFETGLDNYYMAHLTRDAGDFQVLCFTVDGLDLPNRVTLVKIDAEGHELPVLKGMKRLLERDMPVLIVETGSADVIGFLDDAGYASRHLDGSSNRIFEPRK